MTKRIFCIILLLAVLSLSACRQDTPIHTPVDYFYPNRDISYSGEDGLISAICTEGEGLTQQQLLDRYFSGPSDTMWKNPFPKNVTVCAIYAGPDALTLVLSDEYASISGFEGTLANLCLYKTVAALTGHTTVIVQCEAAPILGQEALTLTADTFYLYDNSIHSTETQPTSEVTP